MALAFIKGVLQPQWIVRTLISLALTASTVWVISFKTADYVVDANVSSMGETLGGLQSSLDRLNDAVRDNTTVAQRLQESIAALSADSSAQNLEISFLRSDVTKIANAVQDAGIQIRVSDQSITANGDTSPFIVVPPSKSKKSDFITGMDGLKRISGTNGFIITMKPETFERFDCGQADTGETVCNER